MDKNTVKGATRKIKGKAKEMIGKLTGNKQLEAEGDAEQVTGNVQETAGSFKEKIIKRME